jgi:hypothetical protein
MHGHGRTASCGAPVPFRGNLRRPGTGGVVAPPALSPYIRAFRSNLQPGIIMSQLFVPVATFALVTLIVAAICFWFVREEEKKTNR